MLTSNINRLTAKEKLTAKYQTICLRVHILSMGESTFFVKQSEMIETVKQNLNSV